MSTFRNTVLYGMIYSSEGDHRASRETGGALLPGEEQERVRNNGRIVFKLQEG